MFEVVLIPFDSQAAKSGHFVILLSLGQINFSLIEANLPISLPSPFDSQTGHWYSTPSNRQTILLVKGEPLGQIMVWLLVPRDKYVIVLGFGRHVTRRVHSDETLKGICSALIKTHKTTRTTPFLGDCFGYIQVDAPCLVEIAYFTAVQQTAAALFPFLNYLSLVVVMGLMASIR